MQLANFTQVTVTSTGQAQRRMVDLSLVLDVSSSIGSKWTAVHDATVAFIDTFDAAHDRMSLVEFGNGASVIYPMPASRGFDKATLEADVPVDAARRQHADGRRPVSWHGTSCARCQAGTQSGLRIIVLFTDGASNGVPANWDGSATAKSLRTWDFPHNANDPDSQTWDSPHIDGLYDTQSGTREPVVQRDGSVELDDDHRGIAVDAGDDMAHAPRQFGHPDVVSSCSRRRCKVNGVAQNAARGLRHFDVGDRQVSGGGLEHQQRGA